MVESTNHNPEEGEKKQNFAHKTDKTMEDWSRKIYICLCVSSHIFISSFVLFNMLFNIILHNNLLLINGFSLIIFNNLYFDYYRISQTTFKKHHSIYLGLTSVAIQLRYKNVYVTSNTIKEHNIKIIL